VSTFGIDFDDTFTADPELWSLFIELAESRGHRCVIVTQRAPAYEGELRDLVGADVAIAFCAGATKDQACRQLGLSVDVWVDDYPAAVHHEPRAYRGHRCEPTLSVPVVE
jgi:hypothetical protein